MDHRDRGLLKILEKKTAPTRKVNVYHQSSQQQAANLHPHKHGLATNHDGSPLHLPSNKLLGNADDMMSSMEITNEAQKETQHHDTDKRSSHARVNHTGCYKKHRYSLTLLVSPPTAT